VKLGVLLATAVLSLSTPAYAEEPKPSVDRWSRPWVIVRGMFDAPYGPGAGIEVFVDDRFSMSAEITSRGRFRTFGDLGFHVWPRFRGTHHMLGVGVGGDFFFTLPGSSGDFAGLAMTSLDLHYLFRPIEKFGIVIGAKSGAGVAFAARDFGAHPPAGSPLDHFGFAMFHYVGIAFGARR
jgi:hypothetical protein